MFETEQICPYTGLRAYTEEESLYFKGREEDINQATIQLQRNKFLMLTGASGDGKSSLIYAGIIPNGAWPISGPNGLLFIIYVKPLQGNWILRILILFRQN